MDIFYYIRLCFLLHEHHLLCMSVGGRHLRVADVNHSGKVNSHMYCFSFHLSLSFLFLHTLISSNIYMSVRGRHLHVADVDHYGKSDSSYNRCSSIILSIFLSPSFALG